MKNEQFEVKKDKNQPAHIHADTHIHTENAQKQPLSHSAESEWKTDK